MWTEDVGPYGDLRQGDLVGPVLLPRQSSLPLRVALLPGAEPEPGDSVLLPLDKCEYHLVVSQCCTLENDGVASLAPLRKTRPLSEEEQRAYLADTPAPNDPTGYVVSQHRIDVWGHLDDLRPGQFLAATFTQIQTYTGDLAMLSGSVVRRMTPEGRQALRQRLSLFWGRAEESDAKHLAAARRASLVSVSDAERAENEAFEKTV